MLIYCPKCSKGYEISDDLIKDGSRRVRCSNCNEIFEASKFIEKSVDNHSEMEDISEENAFEALAAMMRDADMSVKNDVVLDEKKEPVSNDEMENLQNEREEPMADTTSSDKAEISENRIADEVESIDTVDKNIVESENEEKDNQNVEEAVINIESIYERLSEHTSNLIEREKTLPVYEKVWLKIKDVLGFHFKIKWSYIFVGVFVFISLSLFNNRYEIVRKLPFMNGVYKVFGIKAKVPGEGLEFQNITWDYIVEGDVKKMEIRGFINNISSDTIEVPIIHVEILDKNTSLLQSFNRRIKEKEISSDNRVSLQIVVENPAPTSKYIYFTFIDKE